MNYLTLKQAFSALADSYLPFMTLFGVLGLLVSTLIVGNVVSGAVVSGYRHIGVLKALGFTPNQVVAVYLTMLSVPAVVGCVLASLGVFNTVLLNTRERRRDLGMLKSIGMTPRQVVVMTVASVAGLGAVGGLLGIPLGIVAHRLVVGLWNRRSRRRSVAGSHG